MENSSKPFVGLHYDIARGAYLKTQYVHEAIKLAAASGYTHFMPYLENMIRLPSMEKASPPCAYTGQDWRAFEATANSAGITLIPWFNVIGHTHDIGLAYPELVGPEDRGGPQLDPERQVTKDWTLRCLDEFCGLSDSPYVVIGGDEWQPPVHLLARPDFDAGRAWVNQVNLAAGYLRSIGKRAIVCHDMLWNYPQVRDLLSRDVIMLYWYYMEDSDYPAVETLKQWGFTTMVFSCAQCGPAFSPRCVDGIATAITVAKKYNADMLSVSTWEDCRWEQQIMQIPTSGRMLQGIAPDADILAVTRRVECWDRLDPDHPQARRWVAQINEEFKKPVWSKYPELKTLISCRVNKDPNGELESYLKYHHPYGPTYKTLKARADKVGASAPAPGTHGVSAAGPTFVPVVRPAPTNPFGLDVIEDDRAGAILRFTNGDESFEVYPQFGASLMDWRRGDDVIIPSGIERFLSKPRYPGGYRSYTNIGGFRAIWAIGAHTLPNIIWQYSYQYSIVEKSDDRIIVECKRSFPHVDITLRIGIEKGRSGFTYEPSGLNKLPNVRVGFHWNLPLNFSPDEVETLRFRWDNHGKAHESTIAQECSANIMLHAPGPLTIVRKPWTVRLGTDPKRTFGYLVDWHPSFLTPDLHELYQPISVGETYRTSWRFELV